MATILLVDDDDLLRGTISQLLTEFGHDVIEYSDGRPAMDGVDFDRVDVILTDLAMPTPGEELIKEVRENGLRMPIIAMSGDMQGKSGYIKSIGAQAVLQKPFRLSYLMDLLPSLLQAPVPTGVPAPAV